MPMKVPMIEPRSRAARLLQRSFREMPLREISAAESLRPRNTSSRVISTCDSAYRPTSAGTSDTPLIRLEEPKVIRRLPEIGSMPIMETSMPSSAAMHPLRSAPSESVATMVRPKMPREKYSGALKSSAKWASWGATVARMTQEKMPPTNEAMVVISSALRDSPRAVNRGPSSMVAAAAAVPGVPTRMAVMLPA